MAMMAMTTKSSIRVKAVLRVSEVDDIAFVMAKKQVWLALLLVLLAVIYASFFTDWFRQRSIQIVAQVRRLPGIRPPGSILPVSFTMDRDYRLTTLRVVELSAEGSAKKSKPVWQLVSMPKSPPIRGFLYGADVPGMKPPPGSPPFQELRGGAKYRLEVVADRARGSLEFLGPSDP
jgi:hypothetical protein